MYRTAIVRQEKYDDVSGLIILSRSTSQTSYSRSISYSAKADTVDGAMVLIDPTTKTFTSASSLSELKSKYIDLNGAIYYIPADATFSQVNVGNGTIVTSYTIQASKAKRMYVVGFRIFSGVSEKNAVQKVNITAASNNGDDLMIGSVCSSCLNVKIISTEGNIAVYKGDELTVYKVAPNGTETQIGVYNVSEAAWISKWQYRIIAYDNVIKLDRDITGWLRGLTGWPYALTEFYGMLATECGLESGYSTWSGASSFMVHRFDVADGTTGRQLMGSICEVMGDYCIAQSNGKLTANWYRTEYIELFPLKSILDTSDSDEQYFYQGSLSYGDFNVEDVGYVQIREEQSEDAALWPDYGADADVSNAYIITGNPILLSHPTYLTDSTATNSVRNALTKIAARFDYTQYRPFKVTIPELLDAAVGKYAFIHDDKRNIIFISPITSMKWSGHKMTLECTAKQSRATADSPENWSNTQLAQYSDRVISRTPQEQLFEKMSGATPGLNLTDGKISMDKDFRNNGMTVEHYGTDCWYYSASDNDEKSLEAWMDGHLSEMPAYSSRTLAFACYPAVSGPRICGTLYRDETTNNAVFHGASYGGYGTIFVKSKLSGTWYATKKLTLS